MWRWGKRLATAEELERLRWLAEIAEPAHATRIETEHRRLIEESGEIPRVVAS